MSRGNESGDRQVDDLKPPPQAAQDDDPFPESVGYGAGPTMSAPGMSEAGGLREAVETAVAELESTRGPSAMGRQARRNLANRLRRALLAAHSAEADPAASERDTTGPDPGFASMCPRCGRGLVSVGEWCCGGWTTPATPDAGDASEPDAYRVSLDLTTGDIDVTPASTSASEPLSEDERDQIASLVHGYGTTYYDWRSLIERIVAAHEAKARATLPEPDNHHNALACPYCTNDLDARLAKARAEAGEQIAQAIEAKAAPLYPHARRDFLDAARIAREVTRPATTGPVDWDSPTWGGGTHEAAWAPDGTHDDITEEE